MKTVCAYCKKLMQAGPDDKVSHGICKRCLAKELAKLRGKNGKRI